MLPVGSVRDDRRGNPERAFLSKSRRGFDASKRAFRVGIVGERHGSTKAIALPAKLRVVMAVDERPWRAAIVQFPGLPRYAFVLENLRVPTTALLMQLRFERPENVPTKSSRGCFPTGRRIAENFAKAGGENKSAGIDVSIVKDEKSRGRTAVFQPIKFVEVKDDTRTSVKFMTLTDADRLGETAPNESIRQTESASSDDEVVSAVPEKEVSEATTGAD